MTRTFAIIPAAGLSQRMGQPKLLMPWRGTTVIEAALAAWGASRVDVALVVVGPRGDELARVCERAGAMVEVASEQPADMKASVRIGLRAVERECSPTIDDAWLVAPADMPLLTTALIDSVIASWRDDLANRDCPRVARVGGKSGHPVLFPWNYAGRVFDLPENAGLNALLLNPPLIFVDTLESGALADLDTPQDFGRWETEGL